MCGVDMADLIWENREDARDIPELSRLRGGKADGKTVDGGVVGIEDLGGMRGRMEGFDDGRVPIAMGGVKFGF